MPWFLVDDDYPTHPGVLATSLAARGLWVTAGAWSSARLTDVVPDHVLVALGSTPKLATELVDAQAWKRVRGGYKFIQEGTCKIPSKEAVENTRKSKAERQARWRAGRRGVDAPVDGGVDAVDNSVPNRDTQTGRSPPRRRRTVDASTRRLPGPDPSPEISGGSVVNPVAGSNGRASQDLIDLIITEVRNTTGHTLDAEWAQRTYVNIIGGRHPSNPAAYLRKAIRGEPDPRTRFLPLY